jgi:hypothetical protein
VKAVLIILAILAIAHLALVGFSVGEGLLLHWLIPSMDLSIAVLAALLATVATIFFAIQFGSFVSKLPTVGGSEEDEEEDEEKDEEKDEEEDEEPPQRSRPFHDLLPHPRRRRRRFRKGR